MVKVEKTTQRKVLKMCRLIAREMISIQILTIEYYHDLNLSNCDIVSDFWAKNNEQAALRRKPMIFNISYMKGYLNQLIIKSLMTISVRVSPNSPLLPLSLSLIYLEVNGQLFNYVNVSRDI